MYSCHICPKSFSMERKVEFHIMQSHQKGNDQIVEAAHQLLNKRMQSSKYWSRKPGTKKEGQGLFRAVIHCNAYNV